MLVASRTSTRPVWRAKRHDDGKRQRCLHHDVDRRRDNPDYCIVARDEYTARAQLVVCHWFNPSIAHQSSCKLKAIARAANLVA